MNINNHQERGAAKQITTFFVLLILAAVTYFLCFAPEGPGFALPKYQRIYNICMQHQASNPKEEGIPFAEVMNSITDSIGNASCKAQSELCKKLPDTCDDILKKVQK